MWLIEKGVILIWDNLQKRRWMSPSYCVLCKRDGEDGQHLLLNCPDSVLVWTNSASTFSLEVKISEGERV